MIPCQEEINQIDECIEKCDAALGAAQAHIDNLEVAYTEEVESHNDTLKVLEATEDELNSWYRDPVVLVPASVIAGIALSILLGGQK